MIYILRSVKNSQKTKFFQRRADLSLKINLKQAFSSDMNIKKVNKLGVRK